MSRSPFDETQGYGVPAAQEHAGATQAPPAQPHKATRRATFSELLEQGQAEIDALRERIERLESWRAIEHATAELLRAQLKAERVEPIDEEMGRG